MRRLILIIAATEIVAGQKIMIRIGSENATKVKAKLREIRHEVTRRGPN